MNGSAEGDKELTIVGQPIAEEKGALAQVLLGKEDKTDSEETASTGEVSTVLSTGKNEAEEILLTNGECE